MKSALNLAGAFVIAVTIFTVIFGLGWYTATITAEDAMIEVMDYYEAQLPTAVSCQLRRA